MGIYRHKHTFNAGELSPLMSDVSEYERYKNGCIKLQNMVCTTQGPATRRPGSKFIYDLTSLGLDTANPIVREIPFIYSNSRAYALVFFMHTDGQGRIVFGTTNSDGTDGLVLGTGVACTYSLTLIEPYTGYDDYIFSYMPGVTVNSSTVTHIADDDTETELTVTTHYTTDFTDGVATITVTAGVPGDATTGYLQLELEVAATAIGTTEVVTVVLPADWDIESFDYAQSADIMYFAQSTLRPYKLERYSHTCWYLVPTAPFTNEPSVWTTNNWPETITFHQQRLVFGGTTLQGRTVWTTRAGDFSSMAVNTGATGDMLDSDAVTFTIDSGTQNRIQWLSSGKALQIGTLGDEWTIVGNSQNALTPSNILALKQTNNGSEPIKPIKVGLATLFIERQGRTVNEFVYDYSFDSYKTLDMSVLAPHMTERYSITHWAYQQVPDSIIWGVREDGDLLGVTYQREHKVVGWHHHDTQGEFKAITCIPGNTREDDVWVVVKRELSGTDKYYLEKFADNFIDEEADTSRFCDSFIEHVGEATDTITVAHLVGQYVDVLADGAFFGTVVVPTGGIVELDDEYSNIVAGLGFVSEVRPLLPDIPTQNGSIFGRIKRITSLHISFYKTIGAIVGFNHQDEGELLEELYFRSPEDATGVAIPLFTGWYEWGFMEGHSPDSEYFIRQTQPLPMTVRSVVDNIEVYD